MKAAKDAMGEEYNDFTREDNMLVFKQALKSAVLKIRAGRSWPEKFVEEALPVAGVGFLERLWEKPIWEGVWPYLDPMDRVCLRTASMEWNAPGKYGPHGELFFFLIQKEPATVPGNEAFSPFFNADIRTSFLC